MHVVIFKQNSCDGGLPNPTGPLSIFHHRPSYPVVQTAKSKFNPIKNPHDMQIHKSLKHSHSHIYINMHHAGHYQLEMAFEHVHLPPSAMGN